MLKALFKVCGVRLGCNCVAEFNTVHPGLPGFREQHLLPFAAEHWAHPASVVSPSNEHECTSQTSTQAGRRAAQE